MIVFLIFIILACLLLMFLNKKDIEIGTIEENNTQDKNIIDENIISNEIEKNNVVENTVNENTFITETKKEETSNSIKSTTTTKSENAKSQLSKIPESETTTQTQNDTQITTNQKTEVNNQTETKEEKKKEEYRINTNIINDMSDVIKKNPSTLMVEKGYSIKIDASIKNSTNQFTYSASRIIDKIKNKFGTIRIYAEDYYVNDQYIMTECYIL